jgi:hypothetical protein
MLTPLGDPPLFPGLPAGRALPLDAPALGPWALVNGLLLVIFNFLDQAIFNKEERERPGSQLEEVQQVAEPLRIQGR